MRERGRERRRERERSTFHRAGHTAIPFLVSCPGHMCTCTAYLGLTGPGIGTAVTTGIQFSLSSSLRSQPLPFISSLSQKTACRRAAALSPPTLQSRRRVPGGRAVVAWVAFSPSPCQDCDAVHVNGGSVVMNMRLESCVGIFFLKWLPTRPPSEPARHQCLVNRSHTCLSQDPKEVVLLTVTYARRRRLDLCRLSTATRACLWHYDVLPVQD